MDTHQRMNAVLSRMALIQYGSTQSWNPTTSGSRDRDPRPPGEKYPLAEEYRDKFIRATNELARQRVVKEATDELETWCGHGTQRHEGETKEEQEDRILREGKGFDPQTVAIRFDTNAGRIRKLRVAKGYLPETGKPLPGTQPEKAHSPERVLELAAQGCTLRQITTITGVSKSRIHRILGRAA